jgi:predicted TPR repeat methyltransferase
VSYQTAAGQAVKTYQQIVTLRPADQQALFSLAQAADTLRQLPIAIGAYKKLLTLNVDPATAAQIRARIKTLQQQQSSVTTGG